MPNVFVAQHPTEAHLLRGLLQSEGILAEVRNEALYSTIEAPGVIPGVRPEVWISDPSQAPRALELIHQFIRSNGIEEKDSGDWKCSKCGELHGSQFTDCWKCGEPRKADTPGV